MSTLCPPTSAADDSPLLGKTREDVIQQRGKPRSSVSSGAKETLRYEGMRVRLRAGVVVSVTGVASSQGTLGEKDQGAEVRGDGGTDTGERAGEGKSTAADERRKESVLRKYQSVLAFTEESPRVSFDRVLLSNLRREMNQVRKLRADSAGFSRSMRKYEARVKLDLLESERTVIKLQGEARKELLISNINLVCKIIDKEKKNHPNRHYLSDLDNTRKRVRKLDPNHRRFMSDLLLIRGHLETVLMVVSHFKEKPPVIPRFRKSAPAIENVNWRKERRSTK